MFALVQNFTLYNVPKNMPRPQANETATFGAHNNTKMWDVYCVSETGSWKQLKLPSFSLSSLLQVRGLYNFAKIEYTVALLTMMGNRMAQEKEDLCW